MPPNDVVKLRAGAVQREANPTERYRLNLDSTLPARQLQPHVMRTVESTWNEWRTMARLLLCLLLKRDLGLGEAEGWLHLAEQWKAAALGWLILAV